MGRTSGVTGKRRRRPTARLNSSGYQDEMAKLRALVQADPPPGSNFFSQDTTYQGKWGQGVTLKTPPVEGKGICVSCWRIWPPTRKLEVRHEPKRSTLNGPRRLRRVWKIERFIFQSLESIIVLDALSALEYRKLGRCCAEITRWCSRHHSQRVTARLEGSRE